MLELLEYYEFKKALGHEGKAAAALSSNSYVAEEKFDGIRAHLYKGLDGRLKAYTRVIGKWTQVPGDKTAKVDHILTEFTHAVPAGTVIDCELILNPQRFISKSKKVASALAYPDRIARGLLTVDGDYVDAQPGYVHAAMFDILVWGGMDVQQLALVERTAWFKDMYTDMDHAFQVEWHYDDLDKQSYLDRLWREKREGVILKNINSKYVANRSDDWLKIKSEKTFDVVFMGITDAKETSVKKGDTVATPTRIAGKAGAIVFGQYVSNGPLLPPTLTRLGQTAGVNDAIRDDITANFQRYSAERRVFRITANEREPDTGAFRHPRFHSWHEDKSATDCIWDRDEA